VIPGRDRVVTWLTNTPSVRRMSMPSTRCWSAAVAGSTDRRTVSFSRATGRPPEATTSSAAWTRAAPVPKRSRPSSSTVASGWTDRWYSSTTSAVGPSAFRSPWSIQAISLHIWRTRPRSWLTMTTVRPSRAQLGDFLAAPALELGIADREGLVDQQDIGLDIDGHRETQTGVHARGVGLHLVVDERLQAGEGGDLVEPAGDSLPGKAEARPRRWPSRLLRPADHRYQLRRLHYRYQLRRPHFARSWAGARNPVAASSSRLWR